MKLTDYIKDTINRLPKGYVFTYADFDIAVEQKEAVIKALNRLAASGKISKLSKGRFYKPEMSPFGELPPKQYQIVKDLLEKNGKLVGYLTGYSIYNQLCLSTQVSNTIQIGKNEIRPPFKRGKYTISFIKQKNTITKDNIPKLQLLDSIKYIKKIPDTDIITAGKRLKVLIREILEEEEETIVRLALKYPPATRAFLGAILDEIGLKELTAPLLNSLNPISKYKFPGAEKVLTGTSKWNNE